MPNFDVEDVPQPERYGQTGQARKEGQQIVFLPNSAHAFEKLAAVEYADPVEEHDQTGQANWSNDLGFWCKGPDPEADKENGSDAHGKSGDTDLTDEVA